MRSISVFLDITKVAEFIEGGLKNVDCRSPIAHGINDYTMISLMNEARCDNYFIVNCLLKSMKFVQ